MKITSSILLCLVFLIFSCSDSPYYIKSHKFKNNTWRLKDKPSFTVDIKDTNQLYDFIFSIRTTTDYKYNNIWVYLYSNPPKGKQSKEAFEIKTTHSDGRWKGIKSGSIVENIFKFSKRKLPQIGKYNFVLELATQEGDLKEVLDATLKIPNKK